MILKMLALILTNKCTSNCDCCFSKCSINSTGKMNLEDGILYIKQAKRISSIKGVGITGGEPFLYYNDLLKLVKTATQCNMWSSCITNGFWGETESEAYKYLIHLKNQGLQALHISYDEFHSKYISANNIKNILTVCKKLNLYTEIRCIVTHSSKRLKDIVLELGNSIINVNIREGVCLPLGNAKERLNEKDFEPLEPIYNKYCTALNTLTIDYRGSVYSCCSQCGFTKPFYLGSTKDCNLKQLENNFYDNIYIYILEYYGMDWFFNIINSYNLPIKLKNKYINICDMCFDLFYLEDNLKYLKPHIDNISNLRKLNDD
jgi:organic radical activating enzyme